MGGKVFCFAGCTGSGKTYLTKQMVKGANPKACHIFDTNNEWKDKYPYPFNPDVDIFLEKAYTLTNAIILFEDATSFFSTRGREDLLIKILIARRHTNNTIIMLFHSMSDIPKYILKKCTHLVIFKTLDTIGWMKKEYDETVIFEAWKKVQDLAVGKFDDEGKLLPGKIPPSKIISLY